MSDDGRRYGKELSWGCARIKSRMVLITFDLWNVCISTIVGAPTTRPIPSRRPSAPLQQARCISTEYSRRPHTNPASSYLTLPAVSQPTLRCFQRHIKSFQTPLCKKRAPNAMLRCNTSRNGGSLANSSSRQTTTPCEDNYAHAECHNVYSGKMHMTEGRG